MSGWPSLSRRDSRARHPAARSLRECGSAPGPRKGVPASPLRFDPGTPFLDQHNTDVYWRGQMQSGERERAGSSQLMDVSENYERADREVEYVAEVSTGECRRVESRGSIGDDRGDGGWRARAVGCERERRFQAGQTTRPGSRRGVRVAASPSSPLGRLLRRSTPWRGASLPPATAARSHAL